MQLVQPAICSERISAVQIGQIDLLGQMSHHAVGVIKRLVVSGGREELTTKAQRLVVKQ
jgi:hypothetical protein